MEGAAGGAGVVVVLVGGGLRGNLQGRRLERLSTFL